MRTTKTISVSLPPGQLKVAERIAKVENRTMSELVREALRRYEAGAAQAPGTLAEAVRLLREDARLKGTHKLTLREINSEIAAVRRGHRRTTNLPVA
jgi:Arc/MetJ-type ribon-helix-helix transcriptional regulator